MMRNCTKYMHAHKNNSEMNAGLIPFVTKTPTCAVWVQADVDTNFLTSLVYWYPPNRIFIISTLWSFWQPRSYGTCLALVPTSAQFKYKFQSDKIMTYSHKCGCANGQAQMNLVSLVRYSYCKKWSTTF
jgi:hypothetical protein